ncbi:MAG TPA: hypothetical protein PLA71_01415 [Saccharofermentans sp.]|nr:hypothetical protein [Saccharofermentans sp.]
MAKSALSKLEKPIEQIQDVMRYSGVDAVSIWKRRSWDKSKPGKLYFGYDIHTNRYDEEPIDKEDEEV